MKDQPIEVHGANIILMDYNRTGFWIAKRIKPGGLCEGQYQVPGGKVDPGETPLEAITRELREETDLDISRLCEVGPLCLREFQHPVLKKKVWVQTYVGSTHLIPEHMEMEDAEDWIFVNFLDLFIAEYPLMESAMDAVKIFLASSYLDLKGRVAEANLLQHLV